MSRQAPPRSFIEDSVLEPGAVYPVLPPDDIHRIETVGQEPSYSLHVLGTNLSQQHRHIFDPESGTVEACDEGSQAP